MNYKLKYNKEIEKSGCFVVAEIMCSINQAIKKEEIMIIFSDVKRQKFYYYKSPFNGTVTGLHIEIGQVVNLNNHIITISHESVDSEFEKSTTYNESPSEGHDSNSSNNDEIGCLSFLKRMRNIVLFIIGVILLIEADDLYNNWHWFIKNYETSIPGIEDNNEGISGLLIIVIAVAIIGICLMVPLLRSLYKKIINKS